MLKYEPALKPCGHYLCGGILTKDCQTTKKLFLLMLIDRFILKSEPSSCSKKSQLTKKLHQARKIHSDRREEKKNSAFLAKKFFFFLHFN